MKYTCIDCAHVFPEAQLVSFKDRFGMLCKGCPKCGCDDLDEPLMDIAQARMMAWFIDRVLP